MKKNTIVYGLDGIDKAVDFIIPIFRKFPIITFTGSLGAGKTTLIQALLRRSGVEGPIQSPTFSLVNRYQAQLEKPFFVYHFDLYRLSAEEEFVAAGFDEYLYQIDAKSLIEWPEVIASLLTKNVCHIVLDYEGLEKRILSYECGGLCGNTVKSI